jgi:hypothetical protein
MLTLLSAVRELLIQQPLMKELVNNKASHNDVINMDTHLNQLVDLLLGGSILQAGLFTFVQLFFPKVTFLQNCMKNKAREVLPVRLGPNIEQLSPFKILLPTSLNVLIVIGFFESLHVISENSFYI